MDAKMLCDVLPQPVFLVRGEKVVWCNGACFGLVMEGMSLRELTEDGGNLFSLRHEEQTLNLPLVLGGCVPYNAYITHTDEGELFFAAPAGEENAGAAAAVAMAVTLRRSVTAAVNASAKLFAMLDDYDDPMLMQEAAALNRSLYQLMRLCSQLSDGGQMLRRRQPVHRVATELCGFFRGFVRDASALLDGADRRLSLHLPEGAVMGDIDPVLLERALYNLLSNSLRFTPRGGTITLSAERRERELLVRFSDDGEGIPPAVLATLYSRFEDPFGDPRRGIGLGLPIVREIVRLHGGMMSVGGNPDGHGTCVTFTLSLRADVVELHSRRPDFDYCGEYHHGLVELSDVLDAERYDPREVR